MRQLPILLAGLLLAATGCCGRSALRAKKPAFKGMELYSWKPRGEAWQFSLLVGTNRMKPVSLIRAPETTITGVADLKRELSALAKEESVA